ncbi:MAG: hypothetical protein L0H63_04555 [Nitrococcus sp.]|nr:hypothetical protein [Nitrococcus sp.]
MKAMLFVPGFRQQTLVAMLGVGQCAALGCYVKRPLTYTPDEVGCAQALGHWNRLGAGSQTAASWFSFPVKFLMVIKGYPVICLECGSAADRALE